MYILIFLIKGKIEKFDNELSLRELFNKVKDYKYKAKPEEFCSGNSSHLIEILRYVYTIEFKERPDYEKIRFMLKRVLLDLNLSPQEAFEWRTVHKDPY